MNLIKQFESVFQCSPVLESKAPGRVNLIGEHTDYNDGFVLPIAIQYAVTVLASPRPDDEIHLYSTDFNDRSFFSISEPIEHDQEHPWSNYQRGIVDQFQKRGEKISGTNLLIQGNVPIASGLSSSAAVEVATAMAIKTLDRIEISDIDLIKLCQTSENEFVGMKCGIMDQFISCMGQQGKALFLDCRNLSYDLIPFPAEHYTVVILNTKMKRELTGSEYNERRSQCEEAVRLLEKFLPSIRALRDVSVSDFQRYQSELPELTRIRSEHVVFENERVNQFVEVMKQNNAEKMGALLFDSHRSLRDLYEVSCDELDAMVDIAANVEGVIGARMTGAGFGGCAIAVVRNGCQEKLKKIVLEKYPEKTNIEPEVYISSPSQGATVQHF